MVILPTIVLFMELAAGCRTPKDPNVQCIDAAVGEGGSWPTVPFGEVLGWEFDFQNSTGGREISIEPSMASGTKPVYVLGPFNGRGDGITTIKQDFACSYDSKVNVKYRLYSCGNLENSEAPDAANSLDWSALNFNGDQQPSTRREGNAGDAVELNPSTRLNEIVRAMNGGNGCEGEGTGNDIWTFTDIEINGDELPEVDEYDTFTLALTGRLSFREEWIAFGGIQVICIANDRDEDKVADTIDNCPDVANPYQKDLDHDDKGDECDDDIDGDWVPNTADKCPTKPGPAVYYGCPPEDKQYGKGGRGDEGKGQGGYRYDTGNRDGGKGDKGYSYRGGNGGGYDGNNNKGDKGQGGRYGYDGGNRDTGRGGGGGGRGRYGYGSGSNSGSGSGSYSSSDSSSRGRRTRNRYERDDKDERRQIEEMLRKLEYEYRGSSKY